MASTCLIVLASATIGFVDPLTWSGSLSGDELLSPARVAIAGDELSYTVYVTETSHNHIARYDESGTLLGTWAVPEGPIGIAVHPSNGNYYVSLRDEGKVGIYVAAGDTFTRTGFLGEGNGMVTFVRPTGLAVGAETGRIYVVDSEGDEWYVFNGSDDSFRAKGGVRGVMNGEFKYPSAIVADEAHDRMIIADQDNFRIQIFNIIEHESDPDITYHTFETSFGYRMKYFPDGEMEGWMPRTLGVDVDAEGRIYVADALMGTVRIFDPLTNDLGKVVTHAMDGGDLWTPGGLALNPGFSKVYVVSTNTKSVEIYETPSRGGREGRGGAFDGDAPDPPGTNGCAYDDRYPGELQTPADGPPGKNRAGLRGASLNDPWFQGSWPPGGLRDSPGYTGPHIIDDGVICGRCHGITDQPGGHNGIWEGQANLCMSCHTGGGQGMDMPVNVYDLADPYVFGEGLSHAWGVAAINAAADSDGPAPGSEMGRYLDEGDLKCTTCHEQHNSDTDWPYLRVLNNRDQMCRECHDTRATHPGSHPVDMVYPNAPLSYVPGASLSDVILKDDRVECMSCHGVHGMDSGGANLGLGDGNLLRMAYDDAMCTSCHDGSKAPQMHGTTYQQGCTICHDTHDTSNANLGLIRQHIVTIDPAGNPVDEEGVVLTDDSVGVGPGAFVDPDPDVKGICEACHQYPDTLAVHAALPDPTPVCTNCHTHHAGFFRPPTLVALYVGSEACGSCHTEESANQTVHGHAHKLNKVWGAPPDYPVEGVYADVPNPPEGAAWNDVSYVIGGYYRKARFINENGNILISADDTFDGAMGVPVQWNLEFPPGGGGLNWVDYHGSDTEPKPYNYSCFQCHTTGASDSPGDFGDWAEAGVQCEACHGPGSVHLNTVSASDITVDTAVDQCGTCHTRGSDNNVILASGWYIRHHEQYPELIGSPHNSFGTGEDFEEGCVTCHEPHVSAYYDAGSGIRTTCTDCHDGEAMGIHEGVTYDRGDYSEELTCVSCHMTFATKSATAAAEEVIGPDARMGDIKTHIFNINTDNVDYTAMFNGDGSEVLKDGDGQAAVTLDFVCLRCHNGITRSATALTLEQASLIAQQMHADEPTYVGATACGACHTNMHADWSGTLHAEAWNNLPGFAQTNAGCLPCHTVGFGEISGYVDQTDTPQLAGVQCENCHGPASRHVADPYNVHPAIDKASEVCGACHTGAHHPTYDEWSESGHAGSSGNSHYGSCDACHAPLGDDGGDPPIKYDVECVACHSPHAQTGNAHDPAEGMDYQLLYPEVVVTEPSNDVDDVQDGSRFNLCGQCHHSRGRTWTATSRGPHHSLQVNTLIGEMPVPQGYPDLVPFTASDHADLTLQCVTCHMYAEEHGESEEGAVSNGRWSEGFDGGGIDQPGNVFHAASWDGATLGVEWEISGPTLEASVETYNDVDGNGDGTIIMEATYVGGTATLDATLWGGSGTVTADIDHYVHVTTYVYVSSAIDWAASSIVIEADMMAQAPTPYELIFEAAADFAGPGGSPLPAGYPDFLGTATTGQWGAVTDVAIEKPAIVGHSWHVNTESCVPCHGSAEAAEALVEGIQSAVQARLDNITFALGDESLWEYSCCGGPPEGWEGQDVIPNEIKKVRFIYHYILGDASLGVHNAAYTDAMLGAAEALLEIGSGDPVYLGGEVCGACHMELHDGWEATGHPEAWAALEAIASPPFFMPHEDPECLQCHTTGFGEPNGYVDQDTTPHLAGVACEECHGVGSPHITVPTETQPALDPLDAAVCGECHHQYVQWQLAGHSDEESRAFTYPIGEGHESCVKCHSGLGFIDFADGLPQEEQRTGMQVHSCGVCHDPHAEDNDYQLRVYDEVNLPGGHEITGVGYSAICMVCHNGRGDATERTSPHYTPAAVVLLGLNGLHLGHTPDQSDHSTNPDARCVNCHMADDPTDGDDHDGNPVPGEDKVGLHTFNLAYHTDPPGGEDDGFQNFESACNATDCHESAPMTDLTPLAGGDYDGDLTTESVQDEVQGLLDLVMAEMENLGFVHLDHYPYWDFSGVDPDDLALVEDAVWNWALIEEDGSMGIHNTGFSAGLLQLTYYELSGADVPNADLRYTP